MTYEDTELDAFLQEECERRQLEWEEEKMEEYPEWLETQSEGTGETPEQTRERYLRECLDDDISAYEAILEGWGE